MPSILLSHDNNADIGGKMAFSSKTSKGIICRVIWVSVALIIAASSVIAQNGHNYPVQTSSTNNKTFRFDVASIKPNKSGELPDLGWEPTILGYKARGVTFWQVIMTAYNPEKHTYWIGAKLLNAPKWVTEDKYDIEARVAMSDLLAWERQGPKRELITSALQELLKERCKIVVHQVPSEQKGLDLVVSEKGLKIKPSNHPVTFPPMDRLNYPDGGIMVFEESNGKQIRHFYYASMHDLADYLSILSPFLPVSDKTGLSGHYDFVLEEVDDSPSMAEFNSALDRWPINGLGLKLKNGHRPGFALFIDKIEKPSPN